MPVTQIQIQTPLPFEHNTQPLATASPTGTYTRALWMWMADGAWGLGHLLLMDDGVMHAWRSRSRSRRSRRGAGGRRSRNAGAGTG
jgi:hypothetical protein